MPRSSESFAATVSHVASSNALWITSQRAVVDGGRGREYEVLNGDGIPLLKARSSVWRREMVVMDPPGSATVLRLLRSRGFLFNGRVEVLTATGDRLGRVYRSGRFVDSSGRLLGRFRDARSLKAQASEGVLQAVMAVVLNLGDADTQLSGPTAFVCMLRGHAVASLTVNKLPFPQQRPTPTSPAARALQRLLPGPLRRWALGRSEGRGWLLARSEPSDADPVLLLAAALFMVEISHW